MKHVFTPESRKRGQDASAATRRAKVGVPTNYVEWNVPTIDRVDVAEFERMLVAKFGPLYLQPVDFAWVDGKLTPVGEWWKADGTP